MDAISFAPKRSQESGMKQPTTDEDGYPEWLGQDGYEKATELWLSSQSSSDSSHHVASSSTSHVEKLDISDNKTNTTSTDGTEVNSGESDLQEAALYAKWKEEFQKCQVQMATQIPSAPRHDREAYIRWFVFRESLMDNFPVWFGTDDHKLWTSWWLRDFPEPEPRPSTTMDSGKAEDQCSYRELREKYDEMLNELQHVENPRAQEGVNPDNDGSQWISDSPEFAGEETPVAAENTKRKRNSDDSPDDSPDESPNYSFHSSTSSSPQKRHKSITEDDEQITYENQERECEARLLRAFSTYKEYLDTEDYYVDPSLLTVLKDIILLAKGKKVAEDEEREYERRDLVNVPIIESGAARRLYHELRHYHYQRCAYFEAGFERNVLEQVKEMIVRAEMDGSAV